MTNSSSPYWHYKWPPWPCVVIVSSGQSMASRRYPPIGYEKRWDSVAGIQRLDQVSDVERKLERITNNQYWQIIGRIFDATGVEV